MSYVVHFEKIIKLKKVYKDYPQEGMPILVMRDEIMKEIIADHPEEQFDTMFKENRIQKFPWKKMEKHRNVIIKPIQMIGLLQGDITHDNRAFLYFRTLDCPKEVPNPLCAYCPYLSHGCVQTRVCEYFSQHHVRKPLNSYEEEIRQKEVQRWMQRHDQFIQAAPKEGTIWILTTRKSGGDKGIVSDGNDLVTSYGEVIKLKFFLPIPACENNPYCFPTALAQKTLEQFARNWYDKLGGKIVKIHSAKSNFPAKMELPKRCFAFDVTIVCDILNLPVPEIVLRFCLGKVVVMEDTFKQMGYSLHYGKYVFTPVYPIKVEWDDVQIRYERLSTLAPPLKILVDTNVWNMTYFVKFKVLKVAICGENVCVGTVLRWQVEQVIVDAKSSEIHGWSYKYGDSVVSPFYPDAREFDGSKVRLSMDAIRRQLNEKPFQYQVELPHDHPDWQWEGQEIEQTGKSIKLQVKKYQIHNDLVYCDVDITNMKHNELSE